MGEEMALVHAAKKRIFDRYFSWCLDEFSANQLITLDYRADPEPRFGYGKPAHRYLEPLFWRAKDRFSIWISNIKEHSEDLLGIAQQTKHQSEQPTFMNGWFLGLDAAAYYSIVSKVKPEKLIEIGSGNSTKFARRAIQDHSPNTHLISIDPEPRADVAAISDEAIRMPLEKTDLAVFGKLRARDIVFVDSSHRSLTNSDVTVFFLEILPALASGVILHFHDIFLPFDYPPEWRRRYYSEQYLLASWLIADASKFEIFFSSAFISMDPQLLEELAPFWTDPKFKWARQYAEDVMKQYKGYSFWATIV
jgi:hypothetical protein